MTTEIDRDYPAAFSEVGDLGREDPMVARPAVDEKQWRTFWSTRSSLEMREPNSVAPNGGAPYALPWIDHTPAVVVADSDMARRLPPGLGPAVVAMDDIRAGQDPGG